MKYEIAFDTAQTFINVYFLCFSSKKLLILGITDAVNTETAARTMNLVVSEDTAAHIIKSSGMHIML